MRRSINLNQILALFVALFVATAFSACSDISGTDYSNDIASESFNQDFNKKVEITGSALDDKGKIYVCKFTRTPGGEEVLKRGNKGLVHVSANSQRNNLPNFPIVNVGDGWQDKHNNSVVLPPAFGKMALEGIYEDSFIASFCSGLFFGAGGAG